MPRPRASSGNPAALRLCRTHCSPSLLGFPCTHAQLEIHQSLMRTSVCTSGLVLCIYLCLANASCFSLSKLRPLRLSSGDLCALCLSPERASRQEARGPEGSHLPCCRAGITVSRRFNPQSGHRPGLWARSPVGGVREATTH